MFCTSCGSEINDQAVICVKCGVKTRNSSGKKSRGLYIVLGLFLGGLGIHNFYAGYNGKGIAQLLIFLFGWLVLFIPNLIVLIWVLIEICTVKEDAAGNIFS